MFIKASAKKMAQEQAEPGNVVEFKQTVAMMNCKDRRFGTVIFTGATYRVLNLSPSKKEWEMKIIDGDGPRLLTLPVLLFDDFVSVIRED
jgi:hypothetical protein